MSIDLNLLFPYSSTPLPAMSKFQRLQCHQLAHVYNLKSQSVGSGKRRFTILTKTLHSSLVSLPESMDAIHKILDRDSFDNSLPPLQSGRQVGEEAEPIATNNIGNKLLRSMGWTGGGLGSQQQGIKDPILATIKNNKHGLGFGSSFEQEYDDPPRKQKSFQKKEKPKRRK